MDSVAVVFATFNRFPLLKGAIESVRPNAGLPVTFVIVDGGSSDGSREWLSAQPDVVMIGQRGELTGATRAFNLAFGYAVDHGFEFVAHLNDDVLLETPGMIKTAVDILEKDPSVGEVAFEFDLFKSKFDCVHGKSYGNFGVARTKAGIEVARAQGDPSGRMWWDTAFRTYGADSQFGAWLRKLGWRIHEGVGLKVHDLNHQDELRKLNKADDPHRPDSKLFWSRWESPDSIKPMIVGVPPANQWEGAKLHLGCGDKRLAGWVNADGIASPATDVVGDLITILRTIPKKSLQKIYSSHVIEHFHPDQLDEVFALIRNALNGKFIVATIDLKGIYENRYQTQKNGPNWNAALFGETNSTDHVYASHKQCFTTETLLEKLRNTGFRDVKSWQPEDYPKLMQLNDFATSCRLVTCFGEGVT